MMVVLVTIWGGCTFQQPLREQSLGDLGRFSFRNPDERMRGIILGAPHGIGEPASADYAEWISEQTGAGLVVAYGFGARRLGVSRPVVRSTPSPPASDGAVRRASVYAEFRELLQSTAQGNIEFYVGIRSTQKDLDKIEVTTSGLTFEELLALKQRFFDIRDEGLMRRTVPRVSMAMEPLDKVSSPVSGIKHHGVLMIAERGMNLRLPRVLSREEVKNEYREILALWLTHVFEAAERNALRLPQIQVKVMTHGRIELIPSRGAPRGVVIGAPHGTFDQHTAEIVEQLSYQTGLPAVIAKGFTPTQCGGWRINVNRPTETRYSSGEFDLRSERAQKVYHAFKGSVLSAAQENLNLYIDIHQNGRQRKIEVATVGISKAEAALIKNAYREIRDRALRLDPGVESVELTIEPIDVVEIGALAAKAHGMLSVAKKSLHFELPLYNVLVSSKARATYTDILAILLTRTVPVLLKTRDPTPEVSIRLQGAVFRPAGE